MFPEPAGFASRAVVRPRVLRNPTDRPAFRSHGSRICILVCRHGHRGGRIAIADGIREWNRPRDGATQREQNRAVKEPL